MQKPVYHTVTQKGGNPNKQSNYALANIHQKWEKMNNLSEEKLCQISCRNHCLFLIFDKLTWNSKSKCTIHLKRGHFLYIWQMTFVHHINLKQKNIYNCEMCNNLQECLKQLNMNMVKTFHPKGWWSWNVFMYWIQRSNLIGWEFGLMASFVCEFNSPTLLCN